MTDPIATATRQTLLGALQSFITSSSAEEMSTLESSLSSHKRKLDSLEDPDAQKLAEQDQYADRLIDNSSDVTMTDDSMEELSKYIPLRLAYEERPLLRLLESALQVSDYTDRVDVGVELSSTRKMALQVKHMCALLSGLVTSQDVVAGEELLKSRDFAKHYEFFAKVFEIGRRYKLLNPERMRDSYGKLVYFLQDTVRSDISDLLGFSCLTPVESVFARLEKDSASKALLIDPLLPTATKEIQAIGKSREIIDREIKRKEAAIKSLASRYATVKSEKKAKPFFSRFTFFNQETFEKEGPLTEDDVMQCLYSICDYNTFLRFNREPCDKIIDYLKRYFESPVDSDTSLSIIDGQEGARLSHSHERQFTFVLQSLSLWREVLHDMFRLWHLAEQDLLDPTNPYKLELTGQGLQRVQAAPRIARAMTLIVSRVQRCLGGWVGSSIVHLGDKNVPNALLFIDKYTQIPRILGPLVLVIDKISSFYHDHTQSALRAVVDSFGGVDNLTKQILRDFFRHAFDGSGGDNFFEAGSCIDGRLTSAWNWCSQIERKPYFPVFLLTGFTGFDGKEGW